MSKTLKVCLSRQTFDKILKHIFIYPDHECGGFLIGEETEDTNGFAFDIHDVYYEPIKGASASFNFDIGYVERAVDYIDRYNEKHRTKCFMAGTYHSHGTFKAFVSAVDDKFARRFPLLVIVSPSVKNVVVRYLYLDEELNYQWADGELVVYESCERDADKGELIETVGDIRVGGNQKFTAITYQRPKKKENQNTARRQKKVLVVGAGTLGNLLAKAIAENNVKAEFTFVDRDAYEVANLPRSPMIDESAIGSPKAFCLAAAVARAKKNNLPVTGIAADVRKLDMSFFEQFDCVMTPLDNLECRFYVNYVCAALRKPYINLGTLYTDMKNEPAFYGEVLFKPSGVDQCLDCAYLLYNFNAKNLQKRVSCGGELPDEVAPQVISSSTLVATVAFDRMMKVLRGDGGDKTQFVEIHDVAKDQKPIDSYYVGKTPACAFSSLHESMTDIPEIELRPSDSIKKIYLKLNKVLGGNSEEYLLDIWASGLSFVKYRKQLPLNSIIFSEMCEGRLKDVIGDEYFPRDHVYIVKTDECKRAVRIKIKDAKKRDL